MIMWLLCVLALARGAHAQYEATAENPDSPLTQGDSCGYQSCLPIKPGWINVHVVPQTHSELGHGYTFHQHYTGEEAPLVWNNVNMKRILDAVLTELGNDRRRKFTLSDTAYLFHWWNNRHPTVQDMMKKLVRQGSLTIAGGGLSISDEASSSYHSIIDQFTYSLRKLNSTFQACARPLVAWAVDVYGHSKEFTSLMAQMGYDGLFINPISYDDEAARMTRQALEFMWRGSDDLGPSTDMFTHNLFDGYWSPPGFCFSQLCSDPLLVSADDSQLFANIDDRVNKFIEAVAYRQAPNYGTRNIMVVMGHRKAYFDARRWFTNIEKLMGHTNMKAFAKGLNVTVFYSNPACYLMAVHDENPELETKQDDFFPYVHDRDSYTVGMYTSRPTFKYLIREAHVYLQMAKQLQVSANMDEYKQLFEDFNWVMGVVQDHSVATGVVRQYVKDYYVEKIVAAIQNSTDMTSNAFTKLRGSSTHIPYRHCRFNVSSCRETRYTKFTIQVYNPLGWPVTIPVRLPIYPVHFKFKVYDPKGTEVKSEQIKLSDAVLAINGRRKAHHELVFLATNLPPVGFRSYYIESQFLKVKNAKRVKMAEMDKYLLNVPTEEAAENKQLHGIGKKTLYNEMYVNNVKGINARRFNANTKRKMKVLGENTNENKDKRTFWSKRSFLIHANSTPKTFIGPDSSTSKVRRNLRQEAVNDYVISEPTEAEPTLVHMLRDYLQNKKLLDKPDVIDTESLIAPSDEFLIEEVPLKPESQGAYSEYTTPSDIMVPFQKNYIIPTIETDIPITTEVADDIQVAFKEPTILKPAKGILDESDTQNLEVPVAIQTTSAESDIIVPISKSKVSIEQETNELDIKIPIRKLSKPVTKSYNKTRSGSKVPVRTSTLQIPTRVKLDYAPTSTGSLAIVPFRTTESIVSATTQSILVVRAEGATELSMTEPLANKTANDPNTTIGLNSVKEQQNKIITDPTVPFKVEDMNARKHMPIKPKVFTVDKSVNTYGLADAVETTTYSGELEDFQEESFAEETSNMEAPTESSDDTSSLTDRPRANDHLSEKETKTTTEKYFKVENGSMVFIGNKYIRVNLDENHDIASVFLSNGVRINLRIQLFYYRSDDPESFDLRHVPRRTIKPPGAYIFRPLDPGFVSLRTDYQVKIIKTDIVEEIQMQFNKWASLVLRLYVDSPVIEVQWLVGPIPTDDGGKDVFIRYSTDLEHGAEFYTDSNGRQTVKRIRGLRAAYNALDLHPIAGNLYPVTSKIYIEDPRKNIRFAVFNDRCQAGGSLVDGALDLMLHRRILTDDIGFGAYLNETEQEEGIRVIGTHYLYVTKADKNRIFEKKFAKEIAMAPRVLTSDGLLYSDKMKEEFSELKNEFSALREKLPTGVHLLTLERLNNDELLIRLENYLEKADVINGVRYVALRKLFVDIKIVWLKETTLAANMFKDQWAPAKWRTKNMFYRSFNEYYGTGYEKYEKYEDEVGHVTDELGGKGIRLAPQQIRTFIVKYEYV